MNQTMKITYAELASIIPAFAELQNLSLPHTINIQLRRIWAALQQEIQHYNAELEAIHARHPTDSAAKRANMQELLQTEYNFPNNIVQLSVDILAGKEYPASLLTSLNFLFSSSDAIEI